MAINMLTIPAILDKLERIFSRAKLTLTDQRNRLSIELLRAFKCLKSWYKLKEFYGSNALQEAIYRGIVGNFRERLAQLEG